MRRIALFASLALFAPSPARASASSDELVRQAQAHEAAHEDDVAARRYSEALRLDPASGIAYLGLGALRMRHADFREAERIYAVALEQVAGLHAALAGLARARWGLGRHADAESTMETYLLAESGDEGALKDLSGWYGADGCPPAQLAAWRRLLVLALASGDAMKTREAKTTVRALQILIGPADPAASPVAPDPTRASLARIARRGG